MEGMYQYSVAICCWDAAAKAFTPGGHTLSGSFRAKNAHDAAVWVVRIISEAEASKRAAGRNVVLRLIDVQVTGPEGTKFRLDKIPPHLVGGGPASKDSPKDKPKEK